MDFPDLTNCNNIRSAIMFKNPVCDNFQYQQQYSLKQKQLDFSLFPILLLFFSLGFSGFPDFVSVIPNLNFTLSKSLRCCISNTII